MREWFAADSASDRVTEFSLEAAGLFLDYSKNRITSETLSLLTQLADEAGVAQRRDAMFAGEVVNTTERRAALHIALRAPIPADESGSSDTIAVHDVLTRMRSFAECVRTGKWTGATAKPITDVINIGIGGSDLGPRMVCQALRHLGEDGPNVHFVSNVDGTELAQTLAGLNAEQTLVIVCSKTFTTSETMTNAYSTRKWFLDCGIAEVALHKHFVAVSTNRVAVANFGIDPANMFEFWDWVGGRFSLWSAVGLSIVLAVGFDAFAELLAGAHAMDEHFAQAPLARNMPIIMAMLGIWYRNFFEMQSHCIAPYSASLELLPAHLQQVDMESNGKSARINGESVTVQTAPIVWGTSGTNGQHAYFQMIHQGSQVVPVDFVVPLRPPRETPGHHAKLLANCFAQGEALMRGRTAEEFRSTCIDDPALLTHMIFEGNRPSNTLLMDGITPHAVGALLALYEHRTFVQGVVWKVNSFDQWGVELGKVLAKSIEAELRGAPTSMRRDGSTSALIKRARQYAI